MHFDPANDLPIAPAPARTLMSVVESARPMRGRELSAALGGEGYVIVGKVTGPLTGAVLQQAGLRLQRRYPGLRARCNFAATEGRLPALEFCVPDWGRFAFREYRFASTRREPSDSGWYLALREQAIMPFDPHCGYMFRIGWVPGRDEGGHVLLTASCVTNDSLSMHLLLDELLGECARIAKAPAHQRYDATNLDPQLAPAALLDSAEIGWRQWLRERFFRMARRVVSRSEHAGGVMLIPSQTTALEREYRFEVGSQEQGRKLLAAAGQRGIALNYLVAAAALVASFVDENGPGCPAKPTHLGSHCIALDFDLRRHSRDSQAEQRIGMFEGTAEVTLEMRDDMRMVDLVLRLQRLGQARLAKGDALRGHFESEFIYFGSRARIRRAHEPRPAVSSNARIHVGIGSQCADGDRFAPLALEAVHIGRLCADEAPGHSLWVTTVGQQLQYSLTSVGSSSVAQSASFLEDIVWLTENTDTVLERSLLELRSDRRLSDREPTSTNC